MDSPFEHCEICGKKFGLKGSLDVHMEKHRVIRRHGDVVPYMCYLCGRCFSFADSLFHHETKHVAFRRGLPKDPGEEDDDQGEHANATDTDSSGYGTETPESKRIEPNADGIAKREAFSFSVVNGVVHIKTCKPEGSNLPVADNQKALSLIDADEIGGEVNSRKRSWSMSTRSSELGVQSQKNEILDDVSTSNDDSASSGLELPEDSAMAEFSELAAQVSEETDLVKFKEDCISFIRRRVSANSIWEIRKELKLLKKGKKYSKLSKLTPFAASQMYKLFCQPLE